MKFLLVREQNGGCDYTIGCGVAYDIIEAKSTTEAIEMLRVDALGDDEDYGLLSKHERELASATLYRIADSVELPLDDWRRLAKTERQTDNLEKLERAQLAALKKKYEK